MFAPKVAKPQAKGAESSVRRLAPRRASFPARPFGGSAIEQVLFLQRTIGNQATLGLLAQRVVAVPLTGDQHSDKNEQEVEGFARKPQGLSWDYSKISIVSA